MDKLKIFGDSRSGNCYKLQLLCSEMATDYDWVEVDILAGDTRTDDFLLMNPNGKIPLLELPDGRHLAESNAILCYLADGSEFFGNDAWSRAEALQWMFFEQYSHEPYIAVARFIKKYLKLPQDRQQEFESKQQGGHRALDIMEKTLSESGFLVGDSFTIADISLFAYTHVAADGGFDLSRYPAINQWIERIQKLPGFIAMGD